MNKHRLFAFLGVLLAVPLLAQNFTVGGPQQSNQSDPLGRYAFLPIEGAGVGPSRISERGYVLAGTDLWHPAQGLLVDSGGGLLRGLNHSNQVVIQRESTNGTSFVLKNLATGAETAMTSGFAPPDEYVTEGEILERTSLHGGVPANSLNDLGQTVGHVWEPWSYTVRYTNSSGGYYTNTFQLGYSTLTGRWDGTTQLLALEGADGVLEGDSYSEVRYGQFTADQRVTAGVRNQRFEDHLILWNVASNTVTFYPAGQVVLINNTGLTVTQQGSSPTIEVLGQGVAGNGYPRAVTDGQPPPYNTSEYPMIVGSSDGLPRIWSRINNADGNKVWEEIDPCSRDQKFSGTLTAANNNGLVAGLLSFSNQPPKAYLLVPAALAVDANRDGTLRFAGNLHDTNLTTFPFDRTSQAEPFRFWVNNDNDGQGDGEEVVPVTVGDCEDLTMLSARDLEDFARMRLYLGALQSLVSEGKLLVGLKWKNVSGTNTPSINVFKHVEGDGGTGYLTDTNVAAQQRLDDSGMDLRETIKNKDNQPQSVSSGGTFIFDPGFFSDLNETNSTKNLLFEGCTEGKGELVITLHNTNGTEIGEGPGVWINLLDVKKLYMKGQGTPPDGFDGPYKDGFQLPGISYETPHPDGHSFEAPATEDKNILVFVHGWNNSPEDAWATAETLFKRLWHKGFKGRFAAFRWPTLAGGLMDHYNVSEHRAWKYGQALKSFVSDETPVGYTINIAAHSMGNVVVGSALKEGLQVENYAMMQAAIPAGCYTTNSGVNSYAPFLDAEIAKPTPDSISDLGYRGLLTGVGGNIVNFYNAADFALFDGHLLGVRLSWEQNQESFKPDANSVSHEGKIYAYDTGPPSNPYSIGQRCFLRSSFGERTVTDIHESMAFVARPRSKAVGTINGIGSSVNVGSGSPSNFGDTQSDHSAQFNRPIQRVQSFYSLLYDVVR